MRLIYFSPVRLASFRQRPHEFVDWWHGRFGQPVCWVEPYPVRLPRWSDRRRPALSATGHESRPAWLEQIAPVGLPLEPLAAGRALNRLLFWPRVTQRLRRFASAGPTAVAVGKPSHLALLLLQQLPQLPSMDDVMDDFPAFNEGAAREASARIERAILGKVRVISSSSTALSQRIRAEVQRDCVLVPNGLASARMPAPALPAGPQHRRNFGYVGTIGHWFDWQWVCELATAWPERGVEIHGPVYQQPPALPPNVKLFPAIAHEQALERMRSFAAGIIPFRCNELTASVDPVKYYEYRALGLPVISTPFGEMRTRGDDPRVLLESRPAAARDAIAALLESRDTPETVAQFRASNDWATRFAPLAAMMETQ